MKQSIQSGLSHKLRLREWLALTLLGVTMFVVQIVLAFFANIEMVSTLIIVVTTVFGWKALISVYIFAFLEIMFHGLGIWNVMYLYVWAILVVIVMLIRRFATPIINAITAAFFGLFFGCLCSVPYFVTAGIAGGIAWIISGIPYDLIHCVANFVFTLLAVNPLIRALKKAI